MPDPLLESANALLRKRGEEIKALEERLHDAFHQNERLRAELGRVTAERDRLSSRIAYARRNLMGVLDDLLERT